MYRGMIPASMMCNVIVFIALRKAQYKQCLRLIGRVSLLKYVMSTALMGEMLTLLIWRRGQAPADIPPFMNRKVLMPVGDSILRRLFWTDVMVAIVILNL